MQFNKLLQSLRIECVLRKRIGHRLLFLLRSLAHPDLPLTSPIRLGDVKGMRVSVSGFLGSRFYQAVCSMSECDEQTGTAFLLDG